MAYYGRYYRSALYRLLHRINAYLLRWSRARYKRLRPWKKAVRALSEAAALRPKYFAHWAWVKPAAGRPEQQEPYDRRLSHTDLWEPMGEIPPGDPTAPGDTAILAQAGCGWRIRSPCGGRPRRSRR